MREILFLLHGYQVMMPVFFTLLLLFFVTYAMLRWRAIKNEDPDPQLGIKAAINFLQFILLLCALLGFSLIFTALFAKIGKSGGKDFWKWGLGMLWGSAVLFAGFEAYYRIFTNQAEYMEVRRTYLGLTLVITGLIGCFAFLLFWMGLFDKWQGLSFNFPFGLWLIFVPATGGGMILFQRMFFPRPAMPAAYPPAGGAPPDGGGYEQPGAPAAQQAPAPQPQMEAPAPAPQPGYEQPQAPQPGYEQPGYGQPEAPQPYPSGGTPAPQAPGLPGPGGSQLPPPGGGYGGGGGGPFGQ